MALSNTPYNNARFLVGSAGLNLGDATAGVFKAMLVTSLYTPNYDTNTYVSDISANEVASANGYARQALTTVSWAKGTNKSRFTSAAVSFAASGGNIVARYMVIFKDTGVATTSPLICCILLDTTPADVTVTNGQTLQVTPDATNGWCYV